MSETVCAACGQQFTRLTNSHLRRHGMTRAEYRRRFDLVGVRTGRGGRLSARREQAARALRSGFVSYVSAYAEARRVTRAGLLLAVLALPLALPSVTWAQGSLRGPDRQRAVARAVARAGGTGQTPSFSRVTGLSRSSWERPAKTITPFSMM